MLINLNDSKVMLCIMNLLFDSTKPLHKISKLSVHSNKNGTTLTSVVVVKSEYSFEEEVKNDNRLVDLTKPAKFSDVIHFF